MNREKCSVTVITFNEERNVRSCLESVGWADEIVVVDSGSTDATLSIAREFTSLIFTNAWPGMREQKNFAASKASHDWIFNLDADERVPDALREEIMRVLAAPEFEGYHIARKNFFLGKWMRFGGWFPDEVLRLYRKSAGRFGGVNPHCKVELTGRAGRLSVPMIHHTYTSFAQYISKQFPYCDAAAREVTAKGGRSSGIRIFSKTVWKFLETYVLKRGFLDGVPGLVVALGASFASYMKQTRIWEIGRREE